MRLTQNHVVVALEPISVSGFGDPGGVPGVGDIGAALFEDAPALLGAVPAVGAASAAAGDAAGGRAGVVGGGEGVVSMG